MNATCNDCAHQTPWNGTLDHAAINAWCPACNQATPHAVRPGEHTAPWAETWCQTTVAVTLAEGLVQPLPPPPAVEAALQSQFDLF